MTNNKVSVGITSIIGWLTALGAMIPTIVKAFEEGQVALGGPEKYLAIFGIASGLITNVARYFQAHKLIGTETTPAASVSEEEPIDFSGVTPPVEPTNPSPTAPVDPQPAQ